MHCFKKKNLLKQTLIFSNIYAKRVLTLRCYLIMLGISLFAIYEAVDDL